MMVSFFIVAAIIVGIIMIIWVNYINPKQAAKSKHKFENQQSTINSNFHKATTANQEEGILLEEDTLFDKISYQEKYGTENMENERMNVEQKIMFLREKVIQMNHITSELESVFPEKSFKMDGIIVGNIVEIMVAYTYGMNLYKQSEKTHDAELNGVKVQIKGTQGNGRIHIAEKPEHLLVEFLNTETGEIEEIYNGPGEFMWKYVTPISNQHNTITVSKLLELNQLVDISLKVRPVLPLKTYQSEIAEVKKSIRQQDKSHAGKTTVTGYTNVNNQTNRGCLHKPGTHANQTAYLMHCNLCGYDYEANGCDIKIRKCPNCQ